MAQWTQAGRPGPFLRRPASSFLPKSSGVYPFHDCTPLDIFEGKDWTENPSLNLYLLCLASKYLDLILWVLSFVWALAFVFFRVTA